MVSTEVTLTEEQAEGLERLAQIRGISVPEYIGRVLEETLKREADDRRVRWKRAVAAIGRFSSTDGRSMSEEHDEMLAEIYEDWTEWHTPGRFVWFRRRSRRGGSESCASIGVDSGRLFSPVHRDELRCA